MQFIFLYTREGTTSSQTIVSSLFLHILYNTKGFHKKAKSKQKRDAPAPHSQSPPIPPIPSSQCVLHLPEQEKKKKVMLAAEKTRREGRSYGDNGSRLVSRSRLCHLLASVFASMCFSSEFIAIFVSMVFLSPRLLSKLKLGAISCHDVSSFVLSLGVIQLLTPAFNGIRYFHSDM